MTLKEIIKQFNINEKEASIYLATLEIGPAGASEIANKSLVQRTYFYDLAENLVNIGLLKQIQLDRKKLYSAVPPGTLVKKYEEKLENLKSVLPELEALYNTQIQKPKVYYFHGIKGIEQINNDTLNYKGEIIGFTTPRFINTQDKKIGLEYIKNRISKGNKVRVIGESNPVIEALKSRDTAELRETRILSKDVFNSDIEIGIYGQKVFIIDYKQDFGFIIESKEVSHTMKMIFELVWNKWQK